MSSIFISYRRADSQDVTGRIYDHLVRAFDRGTVFKDVDNIPFGVDFADHMLGALKGASCALIVIGRRWTEIDDGHGEARLADPNDYVRIEVETALSLGIRVIPVLVGDAQMPRRTEIPESILPLLRKNACKVRPDPDFHRDLEALITNLRALQAEVAEKIAKEEAKRKQEEEARVQEEEARREAAEAKRKAKEESKRAAEEAKLQREEEARRVAEEAKRKGEEEKSRRVAEEAKRKEEEEARRVAEETKRKEEEGARLVAEEAQRREEEEGLRVAEEAKRKEEEETRRVAEEAKRREEEEGRRAAEGARLRLEEEARLAVESAKSRLEAEARRLVEARRRREEQTRREAEEAKRRAEENARREADETKRCEAGLREAAQQNRGAVVAREAEDGIQDELPAGAQPLGDPGPAAMSEPEGNFEGGAEWRDREDKKEGKSAGSAFGKFQRSDVVLMAIVVLILLGGVVGVNWINNNLSEKRQAAEEIQSRAMPLQQFLAEKPAGQTVIRAKVERSLVGGSQDKQIWSCYNVGSPGGSETCFGNVKRDSPLDQKLAQLLGENANGRPIIARLKIRWLGSLGEVEILEVHPES